MRRLARWLGTTLASVSPALAFAATSADLSTAAAFTLSPAALQAAASTLPEDKRSEVAVLWSNVEYELDDQGRAVVRRTQVYWLPRAADDGFEEWDLVAAPWAPWHQDRPAIRARVVAPSGDVRELDPATLSERPAERWSDDVFSDARVLEAPLPGLVDGVVVETFTETRDREPFFAAGTIYRERLLGAPYTHAGRVSVTLPAMATLHFQVEGGSEVRVNDTTAAGVRRLVFDYGTLSRPETYFWNVPADQLPDPEVTFSTARDWSTVAAAYARVIEETAQPAALAQWLAGPRPKGGRAATIDHVLRRLYRDVRYTGLELGAQSIVPFRPEETLRRGFGDCKDQASLVVGALRHFGVEAHVALLRTGRERDTNSEIPGLGQFDHAIVFVPGEPGLWVDPTFKFARAGEVPYGDEGRLALIADPATRELVRVQSAPGVKRRIVETREIWLPPFGKSRVREVTEYFGTEEVRVRANRESLSDKDFRESLESYVKTNYLGGKLDRMETTAAADLTEPYQIVLEISDTGRAVADLGEAVAAVMVSDVLTHVPWALREDEEDEEDEGKKDPRTLPLVVDQGIEAVTRYVIHVPPGLVPRDSGFEEKHGSGPVRLSVWTKVVAPDRVEAEVRLVVERATLEPDALAAAQVEIAAMREQPARLVYFDQVVPTAMLAGDVRSALAQGRALVEGEPTSWFRHAQLAAALLAAGLGREACREAKIGSELDPTSVTAHSVLAWCWQHDEIGRRFGSGFRRAEAVTSYRRALALDADDNTAAINLAVLLERDEAGQTQAGGPELEESIKIYRQLVDKDPADADTDIRVSLLLALYRTGRVDDALRLLSRRDENPNLRQARITGIALSKGGVAAVSEARQWLTNPTQRTTILRGSSVDLMGLRSYQAASIVARAAAAEAPNAAEILRWAEALSRAANNSFVADSPEALTLKFNLAAAKGEPPEKIRPMLSEEVTALIGDRSRELLAGVKLALAGVAKTARTLNADPQALFEFGVRAARYKTEGSEDFGYRITIIAPGETAGKEHYFVTPSPNGWKLAYSPRATAALAALALAALDRGDSKGACRWLDWAFDEDPAALERNTIQRLWSKGELDVEKARRAALALIVEAGADAVHAKRLGELREGADLPTQSALSLALARGALTRADFPALLAATESLELQGGTGEESSDLRIAALAGQERWDDLRRLATQQRALKATEAVADRTAAAAEFGEGRIAAGIALIGKLETAEVATAGDLNNGAWGTLFLPAVNPDAVAWAQRSAEMTKFSSPAILHTLAALYAWTGNTREAYQILLQSLEAAGQPEPNASTWVVMGRLSEDYGLPEVASEFYERALGDPDSKGAPLSVAALARRQLGLLRAHPRSGKAAVPRRD